MGFWLSPQERVKLAEASRLREAQERKTRWDEEKEHLRRHRYVSIPVSLLPKDLPGNHRKIEQFVNNRIATEISTDRYKIRFGIFDQELVVFADES